MPNIIHPTAIIGPNVSLGDGIYIGPYAVIGMHAEHSDVEPRTDAPGAVVIADGVTIHEHVTVQGGTDGVTVIGEGCRIQAHSHIGHDAVLGRHVTISCGARIGGISRLGDYCNVGLNAVLHQYTVLGEGVMVGASAFVKGSVPPWRKVAGVPARDLGINTVGMERAAKDALDQASEGTIQ